MPELLWKAYIDFEIEEGDREKARSLYERLVNLSGHHKVWISYAEFEGSSIPLARALREEEEGDEDEEVEGKVVEGDVNLARQVFDRGYKDLKSKELKGEVRIRCRFTPLYRHPLFYFSASLFSRRGRSLSRIMALRTTCLKCKA